MLKSYNKLWVIGDSYSTPGICVDPKDSFWGLVASYCNIPKIENCSRFGNSFDSVCQLLVGMQTNYNWETDLFLIGMPPLERITIFDDHKNTEYIGAEFDTVTWKRSNFSIESHRGLETLLNFGNDKTLVTYHDRSWTETQVLRTLFLLTTWLDSKNANYVIINLSKPFDINNCWGPSEFVLSHAINHPRCILFKDTYQSVNIDRHPPADFDKHGWNGHHGPAGNKCFFEESLLPKLKQCNLV